MKNELQTYYPEMNQAKPAAQLEVRASHYGRHVFIKTPILLPAMRGLVHTGTLTAAQLVPEAQAKVGWHEYKATLAAFAKLQETYTSSSEIML